MSPVATQTTTTPLLKPHAIPTNKQSVNQGAEHSIEKYAQTLQLASFGAESIKSSNPPVDPIDSGVGPDGGSFQLNGSTASPGLGCATKSCAVCGGCGQKEVDLVKIVSGRENIEKVNAAELKQNETAIRYVPPSNPNLIDIVNSAEYDFAVAKSSNPTPPDQPVSLGRVQEGSGSTHRSPVPPLTQTDPNFPTVKDQAGMPTPQPNVTALTEPLRKPEIVPSPEQVTPETTFSKPSFSSRSSSSAPSKCPVKNFIEAVRLAGENLAEQIRRSVENLKHQVSTAVIVCSSQIGLTRIDQKELTRGLQLINDRSINNEIDKLGATQGASYVSNGKRPEAQDSPKSIQDAVAASHVNHTTDPAKTVSVMGGRSTITDGIAAAKSSNTASQAVSRSSTSGRSNQFFAGFLSLGESFSEIKAAVSTPDKLVANPLSASPKQYPQIVNGQAKSQNIPPEPALAGSPSSSQPQIGQQTSISSPVNPIPSNSAAMSTNPMILSRASASVTNQTDQRVQAPSPTSAKANLSETANPRASTYKQKTSSTWPANPIPSNSAAMPTNPVILSRASASVTIQANQRGQAPSPTSAEANLSKTVNPRASNYNLSLRRVQLDTRTTSYMTLSPRRAAVARNLENLALKLPSSLSNRIAEVTTNLRNLRFALSRNSASTTFNLKLSLSRRFAINSSQANQPARKLQTIAQLAQSLRRATRELIELFRTVKFNPKGQVPTATRLKSNTSVSEALARVASKIKSIIEPKRIDAAELVQKLNTRVLNLRQKILAAFRRLTPTIALSRSTKAISREVQASLSKKITESLPRLRFLVAQLTNLKARQASFQLNQASLRFRILTSILTRNLNNSARSLKASARSLIIQAKLNLASSTAQSLRRILLARFLSLQRRLLAAKVNTARAIRFSSQRLSSEAALRAGLLQRKILLPSLRLRARTQKFAKLKLSQSWHKLLERFKVAGKTSQAKVPHFRKVRGTPQKVLNAQPGSWQKLMLRKDLIVRFNSVAQRFLPLLLRAVNLITRSSHQHPFWFFLLELVKRRDKKKDWFKNNKVFLAQFLYIFSLILKQLNKAGRGVESLNPQELLALVRKALSKTFSQSAQQPQVVSADQAKGSKSIFAVNKSATPYKNLSIFQAKI